MMVNDNKSFFGVNKKVFEKSYNDKSNKFYLKFYDRTTMIVKTIVIFSKGIFYFPFASNFIFCYIEKDKDVFTIFSNDKLKELGIPDFKTNDTDIDSCLLKYFQYLTSEEKYFNIITSNLYSNNFKGIENSLQYTCDSMPTICN